MQYQQQQYRNSGYAVPGNREIGQGQMDQGMGMRGFHGDGMHAAAPMSRTPSLRVEDASKNNYPSVSPNGQMSFHQTGFPENHPQYQRPGATPVQGNHHWPPSDGPVSSTSQSSHSADLTRSHSSQGQQRHRPAPLNLQNVSHQSNSNDRIQVEGSPFEPSFRSASAVGTPSYSQSYPAHPGNRLHSIPNLSSPAVQDHSPYYGTQQVSPYAYQQQQQQPPPLPPPQQQQVASQQVASYSYSNGLPSIQQYAPQYAPSPQYQQHQQHPQHQQHQQSYALPSSSSSSYLRPGQPQMPPLPHMAHSAPSAIPQQSSTTSAAYHQFPQHRPNLLHTGSFPPTESSSFALERPEYTGFSAYPINRGQDRPHKCDQCTQSFNRNHDLKRHKRIHLEVKPFACSACQKQFSRRDALKRHWLVKNCDGDRNDPNNPAYEPPSGPDRKNAAAIPRHYQTISKKAQQDKLKRQEEARARKEANKAMKKGSESSSDRSKSSMGKDDEPLTEIKGNSSENKPYSGLSNVPALSPPTPSVQNHPAPYAPGPSMARSASHNTTLVTPDENSVSSQTRLGSQPSTSLHPSASLSIYSQSVPSKPEYLTGPYSSYDPRPPIGQLPYSTSTTGVGAGQFSWQAGHYATTPSGPSGGPELNILGSEGGVRSVETMVTPNNPYVMFPTPSAVVEATAPKPTRRSKDYFDGVVFSNTRVHSIADVDSTMSDVSIDPTIESQQSSTHRPVFTMPFGNSDTPTEAPMNPLVDNMKGPWQRWHRPSFPFPMGQRPEVAQEEQDSSRQNSLHPGMQQPQQYARSSLRLSHSPNNNSINATNMEE